MLWGKIKGGKVGVERFRVRVLNHNCGVNCGNQETDHYWEDGGGMDGEQGGSVLQLLKLADGRRDADVLALLQLLLTLD